MDKKLPDTSLDWIEEQQNHSWQIEILISGGLIYTLYQLPDQLKRLFILVYENTMVNDHTIALLIGAYFITQTLLIGFSVNLLIRAIWVAYLGINFSFPAKNSRTNLGNKSHSSRPGLLDRIILLEKLSSLSYSIAIISALMSIGLLLVALIVLPLSAFLLPDDFFDQSYFVFIYIICFILLFFTAMNSSLPGFLKKFKWIRRGYHGLALVFSILSLYFIYNKGWKTLISNVNKWKVYLLQLSYLLIAVLLSLNQIGGYYNNFSEWAFNPLDERQYLDVVTRQKSSFIAYDNKLGEDNLIFKACIQEEFISDSHIQLFLVYWVDFDRTFKYHFEEKNLVTDGSFDSLEALFKNDSLYSESIDELFEIKIGDGAEIEGLEWFVHKHHLTKEEGFLTYIPLDSVSNGLHKLNIDVKYYYPPEDTIYKRLWEIIPFIKE